MAQNQNQGPELSNYCNWDFFGQNITLFILQDLVAWITTGFLHIPHAEDIPNTVTVGNGGSIILRPHNYFDEDPSIHSPDGVYFEPGSEDSCEYNKMACLTNEYCPPPLDSYSYSGFDYEWSWLVSLYYISGFLVWSSSLSTYKRSRWKDLYLLFGICFIFNDRNGKSYFLQKSSVCLKKKSKGPFTPESLTTKITVT